MAEASLNVAFPGGTPITFAYPASAHPAEFLGAAPAVRVIEARAANRGDVRVVKVETATVARRKLHAELQLGPFVWQEAAVRESDLEATLEALGAKSDGLRKEFLRMRSIQQLSGTPRRVEHLRDEMSAALDLPVSARRGRFRSWVLMTGTRRSVMVSVTVASRRLSRMYDVRDCTLSVADRQGTMKFQGFGDIGELAEALKRLVAGIDELRPPRHG